MSVYINGDKVAPVVRDKPEGTINITQNGTDIDVAQYATADVNVVDTRIEGLLSNTLSSIDDSSIQSVASYGLYYKTALTSISLPNATNALSYAFAYCTYLTSVNLPKLNLDAINSRYTFSHCERLQFIKLNALQRIPSYCFNCCYALKTAIFPNLSRIDNVAFSDSSNLRNLIISQQVTLQGTNAFHSNFASYGTVYTNYVNVSWYPSQSQWSSLTNLTYKSIQENLVDLQTLGVDISDYYLIVTELPTDNISTTKVYLIETATAGTYNQYFNPTADPTWTDCLLPDTITLGGI